MSQKQKAAALFAETVERQLGLSYLYDKRPLSDRDSATMRDAYLLWMCIMYDQSQVHACVIKNFCTETYVGRLLKLSEELKRFPVVYVLKFLKAYKGLLQKSVEEPMNWTDFKHLLPSDSVSREIRSLALCLFAPITKAWLDVGSPVAFAAIYQDVSFLDRVTFLDEEELATAAYQKWIEVEAFDSDFDSNSDSYSELEREIAETLFPMEDLALLAEQYQPTHGTGSTYEGVVNHAEKYFLNDVNDKVRLVHRILGYYDTYTDPSLCQNPYPYRGQGCGNTHRGLQVPKNWAVYRGVSMEPIGMMFAQKGGFNALSSYFRTSPVLRRIWAVSSEDRNRRLAQAGSRTGNWATIDLSNASDTVRLKQMTHWLRNTCLYPFLNLRTDFYQCPPNEDVGNGSVYRVSKLAPMGSALCFPFEVVAFTLIAIASWLIARGLDRVFLSLSFDERLALISKCPITIYGDDIVTRTDCAEVTLSRLTKLGFQPNVEKSFYNSKGFRGFFRESCGGEYLNGYDVTPVKISRKFSSLSFHGEEGTAAAIPRLISLSNDLWWYPLARKTIIRKLLRNSPVPILFDSDGSHGIRSRVPTNFHIPPENRRINVDLQRPEVLAFRLRVKKVQFLDDAFGTIDEHISSWLDSARLYEWLRIANRSVRNHGSLIEPVGEELDPHTTRPTLRCDWTLDEWSCENSLVEEWTQGVYGPFCPETGSDTG